MELKSSIRSNGANSPYAQELLEICLHGRCSSYYVKMLAKTALSDPQYLQFFVS